MNNDNVEKTTIKTVMVTILVGIPIMLFMLTAGVFVCAIGVVVGIPLILIATIAGCINIAIRKIKSKRLEQSLSDDDELE